MSGPKELFYFTLPARDLEKSKAFYSKVFGWEYEGGSLGGNVGNTTIACGLSPGESDPSSTMFYLTTFDVNMSLEEVRRAGGTILSEMDFENVGRCAFCTDNQGVHFALQQPAERLLGYAKNPKKGTKHGDIFFFSIPAKEEKKAREFYSVVAGWEFSDPKGKEGGLGVSNTFGANGGLGCGREGTRVSFWFRVDDINKACEAVVSAQGKAGGVFQAPEGTMSECYDDQGVKFGLVQPAAGY